MAKSGQTQITAKQLQSKHLDPNQQTVVFI